MRKGHKATEVLPESTAPLALQVRKAHKVIKVSPVPMVQQERPAPRAPLDRKAIKVSPV